MLRDPRDVVLSCYVQSFELNGAMAYFLDQGSSARYYNAVMQLAEQSLNTLGQNVATCRYEQLVKGFEPSMRQLLEFLGLAWDERVLDYRRHAQTRAIDTPSYQQVSQPLYTRSIGRWRHYPGFMQSLLPVLGPWAERFDYPPDEQHGGRDRS